MPRPVPTTRAPSLPARSTWVGAILAGLLASAVLAYDLPSEPSFVDEWAYLSQTYYSDLWLRGDTNHRAWLEYPAYDLPPLPKYLFGLALRAAGYRRPAPEAALRWYANTSSRCGPPAMLVAARWPAVVLGALGCAAIYGLGTIAWDRRVGGLAALFLMFNPLYRLHARRAMSDVIAEGLILVSAAAALWAWRRMLAGRPGWSSVLAAALSGIAAGLAPLAKLNGALAMLIIASWAALALALPRVPLARKFEVANAAVFSGIVSLATFIALNPFLTARPRGNLPPSSRPIAGMSLGQRMLVLVAHRMEVSQGQQVLFPHNALPSPLDKLGTVAVQGFGRFGPLGPHESRSQRRYDLSQDWGAVLWLPLVGLGAIALAGRGRTQLEAGEPPAAWAILAQAAVALVVVTSYLPLAWDRYYLSLQPGSALLASAAFVAAADRVARLVLRVHGGT